MQDAVSYGTTRQRREVVTYAQIERTATDILKTGVRPTLESVRKALGGGSPRTILEGLNRYWRDLGSQVAGSPDTLRRLPAAVADLAEGIWQRALVLATDAAQGTTSEAEGQLSRLKSHLEVRQHTLSQREIELDELLRSRERTVKELEENLRAALSMLTKRDATLASLETRLAAAVQETDQYRKRLAAFVKSAVERHLRRPPPGASKPRTSALKLKQRAPKAKRKLSLSKRKRQQKPSTR